PDAEAGLAVHRAAAGSDLPTLSRQGLCRIVDTGPECQRGAFLRGVGRTVGEGERRLARALASLHIRGADIPPHRSDWRLEGEALRGRHVELPSKKGERESVLEHEAIAKIPVFGCRRVERSGRAAHQAKRL